MDGSKKNVFKGSSEKSSLVEVRGGSEGGGVYHAPGASRRGAHQMFSKRHF